MEQFGAILLVILVAAIVVAAIRWSMEQARKRREALASLAAGLGLAFDPDTDRSVGDRLAQFDFFTRGHSRRAFNTLSGSIDIDGRPYPCLAGDFEYKITRSNGKTTTTSTYRFSYLVLGMPLPGVPDLVIRREGLLDKIAGAIGFDDIDFESEAFSRAFHVKSGDKRFAYGVVHPKMMEFLMAGSDSAVHIRSGAACFSDGSRRWEPEGFRERFGWARRFFELWPRHVWDDIAARNAGVSA